MKVSTYFRAVIFLTFFSGSITVYGQARVTTVKNGPNTELYFTKAVKAPTYNEVIGSPYLHDEFVPAKVNEIEVTHFIRFNVFDNSIEFKGDNDKVYSMTKPNDYIIKLMDGSNKVYETRDFEKDKKEVGNTFFERIYVDGKFALYLKEMIEYTPEKLARNSFEINKPAKFIKTKGDYYFQKLYSDTPVLLKLPKREKHFLKLFNDQATSVKGFIKKEGLHIEKEKDLIRILRFYFAQ